MSYQVTIASISHPGLAREDNEDSFLDTQGPLAGTAKRNDHCHVDSSWLVAVADGMGGANAGEVASRIAVESLHKCTVMQSADIENVLLMIHHEILKSGTDNTQWHGMGAAIAGIGAASDGLYVFNIGDCSVFREVEGFLQLLTVDDSIAAMHAMPGTVPDGPRLPGQNRLTQALGGSVSDRSVQPHVSKVRLMSLTRFLLCTDGLTDMVSLDNMEALTANGSPTDAVEALLSAALAAGGKDNITVMVMDLLPII